MASGAVAAPAAGAPAAPGAPAAAPRQNPLFGILRMFVMWYMFKQFFGGGQKPASMPRSEVYWPRFEKGTLMDLSMYLSEEPVFRDWGDGRALVWRETDVPLASGPDLKKEITYHPSQAVQNNGTLFLHVFLTPAGLPLDPEEPLYDADSIVLRTMQVNRYMPRPRRKEGVSLLGSEAEQRRDAAEDAAPQEIISFLPPNISLAVVNDFQAYPANAVPDHMRALLDLDPGSMTYAPVLWLNDFWLLRDKLVPVNATLGALVMELDVHTLPLWKLTIYSQMEKSFSMQSTMGVMAEGESDEFKRVLLEGNPALLAVTFAVSLLHSVFDVLAFKNDIGFWRNKKSVEGLSVRSIVINAACQVIIFLYLLDNDTSYVVLFSAGLGLLIELWKVTRAMSVSIAWVEGVPRLAFGDKAGYATTKTKEYDEQAMRYLSYVLYPLVAAYAVYALLYETHKSWYSWVLNSLVGAVYTFGFILMCPQLFINYKLKSVAHLPWRQMTYKFLNTIIDDLFAFVIKMPTLHRLSVFRDDIIFLFQLYQRWIYPIDKKRANEYAEVEPEEAAAAEAAAALPVEHAAEPSAPAVTADATAPLAQPPGTEKDIGEDDFEDINAEEAQEEEAIRHRRQDGPLQPALQAAAKELNVEPKKEL